VVGINDSVAAADALRWAASRSGADHCPLVVVHAFAPEPGPPGRRELLVAKESVARSRATGWLRDTLTGRPAPWRARLVVAEDDPSALLVRWSATARMLVLGQRAGTRGHVSAVAARCEADAACPVVLVPEGTAPDTLSTTAHAGHEVVSS
jgi:hypothetical protein